MGTSDGCKKSHGNNHLSIFAVLAYITVSTYSFFYGLFIYRAFALLCLYPLVGRLKPVAILTFVSLVVHTISEIREAEGISSFLALCHYLSFRGYDMTSTRSSAMDRNMPFSYVNTVLWIFNQRSEGASSSTAESSDIFWLC